MLCPKVRACDREVKIETRERERGNKVTGNGRHQAGAAVPIPVPESLMLGLFLPNGNPHSSLDPLTLFIHSHREPRRCLVLRFQLCWLDFFIWQLLVPLGGLESPHRGNSKAVARPFPEEFPTGRSYKFTNEGKKFISNLINNYSHENYLKENFKRRDLNIHNPSRVY